MRRTSIAALALVLVLLGAGCSKRHRHHKASAAAARRASAPASGAPNDAAAPPAAAPSPDAAAPASSAAFFEQDPLKPAFEASPAAGDTKDIKPVHVTFDWSPPCRVPALYVVKKQGHTVRMRMTVALEKADDGFTLSLEDMKLLRLDQLDATRPDVARALAPATALMTHLPSASISGSGEFSGVRDLAAFTERLSATFASSPVPELRKLADAARQPAVQKVMASDLGALWASWVQSWLAFAIPPGAEKITTIRTQVGDRSLAWPALLQHRGAVRGAPGLALLSIHETFEGRQAEALLGVTDDLAAQLDASAASGDGARGLAVERNSVVAIDPARGRPYRARDELRTHAADGASSEVRDTAFDWDHAVGCGR